jgi:YHS domain-containing protein
VRFLIYALLGYALFKMFTNRQGAQGEVEDKNKSTEEIRKDPICGVYVSEDDAVIGRHEGQRLFFCSKECLEKYRDQLEQ